MTVAQEQDEWFCENFIDLPDNLPASMTRQEAIQMIKTIILGKSNNGIIEVEVYFTNFCGQQPIFESVFRCNGKLGLRDIRTSKS